MKMCVKQAPKTLTLMKISSFYGLALFFALIFFSETISGQRHEIGLFGGGSYYLGDINPKKHFAQTQIAFGGIYRYNINPHWAMRVNAYRGRVESSDAVIRFNQRRNLSFRSEITEIAMGLELNFFPYMTGRVSMSGRKKMRATPFIFAGLGYFKFNPQAYYEGKWYDLQPLGTEGQGTTTYYDKKAYSLGSFAVPFGIGAKFSLAKNIAVAFEWGLRKTFTDYLDDVSTTYADPLLLSTENSLISGILSDRTVYGPNDEPLSNVGKQRGDSSTKDWYSFAGVTVTFKIKTRKADCPGMPKKNNKYKDYQYE
jgi:hypothetical protein